MAQMKRMTIIWGIIMVLIFGALTTYGFMFIKKIKPYRDLEEKLVEATKEYSNDNYVDIAGDGKKITYKDLVDNEYYVEELKVKDDSCTGYVKISYKKGKPLYKAYIKCAKYTTVNY